jgi:hypothetical protein
LSAYNQIPEETEENSENIEQIVEKTDKNDEILENHAKIRPKSRYYMPA